MTEQPPASEVSHGIASVLPFLYIAWADGLLAPSQVAVIREQIERQAWLSEADKATLRGWLDPTAPPSATDYYRWVRAIKQAARHVPDAADKSLAELGAALAEVAGVGPESGVATPEACEALAEMEAALGIVGREAVRELVETRPPGDGAADPAVLAPPFDPAALQALLDGDKADLRARVRLLLQDPVFAYPEEPLDKEAHRELVFRWLTHLADQGLGALAYPESVGGEGDIAAFIAVFEELCHHDLSLAVKFGVQFGLFGGSINQLGSQRHRQHYLPAVASVELPGCFAMTEKRHGSNVRDLQTTATYHPETGEFVVHTPHEEDHKEWIGNAAAHGRMATVFAQLVIGDQHYGVHAFLVPLRSDDGAVLPGVRIEDSGYKLGLNGVDNGRIWFDHVRIPRENLLDRFAEVSPEGEYASPIPSSSKRFFTMLGTLVGGRIAVASGGLAASKNALTIAVRYGARRRQFGPKDRPEVPILDYLSHQRRLLPYVAAAYGLTFALHDLAGRFQATPAGADLRAIEAEAAALKALATRHASDSIQESREACGGEGYRYANRLARLRADADIFTTFEGDNTVLLLQVAKSLLSGYKEEFENLDFFGLLGKLRERVEVRIGEPNPLQRRRTGEAHLLDSALHADLFESRERDLLVSAARRLKGRLDAGEDSFDAFIDVQDHLLTLARAHAERVVLDRFQAAVNDAAEGVVKERLERLCALYALWILERDRGWFLEQHYIDAPKAKAIRAEVNALLGRLRPDAVALVDAFGIPDALLAAPIAVA
ncbi:MAG: acyl-CoA dehydrogenase [Rubricoccaceae bacterium]|nr:acyl-CoA dehydrogenase [Rubricoccaceae bacterium]